MIKLFLFAIGLVFARCVEYIKAPCPDAKGVDNFNISVFGQGKWYEIARYPNDILKEADCVTTQYDYTTGTYNLTDVTNGNLNVLRGYFSLAPNVGNTGVLNFRSSNITAVEGAEILPVHILDTDYDNYSVMYECRYNETTETKHEFLGIFSRQKKLDGNPRNALQKFLDSSFLEQERFKWDKLTEESCKETSDIEN